MKIRTLVLVAIAGAGALAVTPASAYVACNGRGDCWHTTERQSYRSGWGVRIHDDNWKWRARDHYRWREHDGHGYWNRSHVWITF